MSFREALRGREHLSLIAEIKRRSPSAGELRRNIDITGRVASYAAGGAAAVSVLTEAERFGGSLDDLRRAAGASSLPVLMKDFVSSASRIESAVKYGASAVLLIVRTLERGRLSDLLDACASSGLDALVECVDEEEIEAALGLGATLIGVNNRDLATLRVDTGRAARLLATLPEDVTAVAESGYATREDLEPIRGIADAVLVGTSLMRADDPKARVEELCS